MNESPILGGVHSVPEIDTADDFSKKHVPFIAVSRNGDEVEVVVEVGHYVAHPNMPDHWIDQIIVYAKDAPIATYNFAAGVVAPKVVAKALLDPGAQIMASARCNLHGLWVASTTV
jgi:desulfoferrodoxin-like iron-binding protein